MIPFPLPEATQPNTAVSQLDYLAILVTHICTFYRSVLSLVDELLTPGLYTSRTAMTHCGHNHTTGPSKSLAPSQTQSPTPPVPQPLFPSEPISLPLRTAEKKALK